MLGHLFLSLFIFQTIEASLQPPQRKWMTLNGGQPEVVAHGGYSGFYPDSSQNAYDYALETGIHGGTILYCNLHFTKDNDGFCLAQINLQNATDIENLHPKAGPKTYNIYGQQIRGYFGLDYPANIIFDNVTLRQNIYTRHSAFDGDAIIGPFQFAEDIHGKPTRRWINVDNNMFYEAHNISPETFILEQLMSTVLPPEFISSPEIAFLKSIGHKLGRSQTKLIFTFLQETALEPTTNVTYASLAKNLAAIKSFASGIVVPKEYIWPVNMARVLQPATSLVQDAHKVGLAVYASGFANDNYLSFNYSYDPAREYLQFLDNPQFSVDGVLSDFPSTASEAIGCLSQNKNASRQIKALIISHNGASGDFPGATDLAYLKAIEDGADIIDCSVQMSKDGIAFCSDRADLMKTTTAATLYIEQSTNVPQIQTTDGIFSFDLTWTEIQSLRPQIEDFFDGSLIRNPANKNSGKFVTLSEFLQLSKTKSVTGVLISIQNAAFLASKGLDIVGTVSTALSNATLSTTQKVLIQSDDTSVLLKFKDMFPSYQRVLYLQESISGVPDQVAQEVKKYADAVFVHRDAIMVASDNFASKFTTTVPTLHAANISVYVGVLKNEFQNFIFDYLSDPYVELATFYSQQVDGFVTDYPATANSFVRSTCTTKGSAYLIPPVQPFNKDDEVAEPPLLSTADVVDPPLPAIANNETAQSSANDSASPTSAPKKSSTTSIIVSARVLFFTALVALFA